MADVRRRRTAAADGVTARYDVIHDDDNDHDHARPTSIWTAIAPALLISSMAAIVLLAYYCGTILPEPKPVSAPLTEFSEARARPHLDTLCSYGVRMVGSKANEENAVFYIMRELDILRRASGPDFQLEVQLQRPTGAFDLHFLGGFTNYYQNVSNILVRASWNTDEDRRIGRDRRTSALMLSAHYDTAPGSPGASDDAVNVATLLELLRALSLGEPLPHAIIFVFTGAEESVLPGSHGFITQHPWGHSIRAFINLEGAGGGGRELVFQSGPSNDWLIQSYARVAPYPFANIVGQEVFQTGIIPSDTDYRIYRDYGGIPGIDVAYISNGYIYHTPLDTPSRVHAGTLQRCGDNMLAVVRQLASSSMFEPSAAASTQAQTLPSVYFDIMGLFMVIYSRSTAQMINWSVAIYGMIWLYRRHGVSLRILGGVSWLLVTMIGAIVANLVIAAILHFIGGSMAWFATPVLIIGLFAVPAIGTGAQCVRWTPCQRHTKDKSRGALALEHEEASFMSGISFWLLLLIIGTAFNIGSSYLPMTFVLFPLLARSIVGRLQRAIGVTKEVALALSHSLGLIVPVFLFAQVGIVVLYFFTPLMGRSGTQIPADVIIAVLTAIVCVIPWLLPLSLVHLDTNWRFTRICGIISVVIVTLVSMRSFPYSAATPKRVFIQHTERFFYDEWDYNTGTENLVDHDSGLWMNGLDHLLLEQLRPLSLPANMLKEGSAADALSKAEYTQCDGVYCSMPYILPIKEMCQPRSGAFYMDANRFPSTIVHPTLKILEHIDLGGGKRRLHLRALGPDHMILYIQSGEGKYANLTSWSLDTPQSWATYAISSERRRSALERRLRQQTGATTASPATIAADLTAAAAASTSDDDDGVISEEPVVINTNANVEVISDNSIPPLRSGLAPDGSGIRSEYFLFFTSGLRPRTPDEQHIFDFWLEISGEVNDAHPSFTNPQRLGIALAGHYFDGELASPELTGFYAAMPDWIAAVGWLSSWAVHYL